MAEAEVLEVDAPEAEGTPEAPSLVESVVEAKGLSPELRAQLEAIEQPKVDEVEASEDQDTPSEPEAPEDRMPQWVADVSANPKSITQVPRSQQAAVIDAWREQIIAQANEHGRQMYLQGQRAAQESAQSEARVSELKQLRQDDPEAFLEWQEKNPQEAAKFLMGLAPPSAPDTGQALLREAGEELAKLDAYPEAKARIVANEANYPITTAGLRALAADVAVELAKAQNQPARKQAEQRQQAAETVRSAPKADIAGGSAAAGPLTLAKLKTMSAAEIAKYPKDVVDAALRAG